MNNNEKIDATKNHEKNSVLKRKDWEELAFEQFMVIGVFIQSRLLLEKYPIFFIGRFNFDFGTLNVLLIDPYQ